MLLMRIYAGFFLVATLAVALAIAEMTVPRGLAIAQVTPVFPPGTLPACSTNPGAPTTLTFRRCCILDTGATFCGNSSNTAVAVGSGGGGGDLSTSLISELLNVNTDADAANNEMMIGDGTSYRGVLIPGCDEGTEKMIYIPATRSWSCETDGDNLTDDLLNALQDVNADAVPTDDQMIIGDGTQFRGVPLLNCNPTTEKLIYSTGANSFTCETDGGGGGTQGTLDDAFDAGNEIDGAACETTPVRIARTPGSNNYWDVCVNTSGVPSLLATCNGGACDSIQNIPTGKAAIQQGNGTEFERVTAGGVHTYSGARRPLGSISWAAWQMRGDGAQCNADPTTEDILGSPSFGLRCPMTGADTDGFIYGVGIPLPGNFEKTTDVTFDIKAYLITDAGAGTWHGLISIACVANGEARAWGAEVDLDLTPAAADVVDDEIHDTIKGVTVVDTDVPPGANCDPGDTFYWRWRSCDTDTSPTAGCGNSLGFEDDMSVFAVRVEYRKKSETE